MSGVFPGSYGAGYSYSHGYGYQRVLDEKENTFLCHFILSLLIPRAGVSYCLRRT